METNTLYLTSRWLWARSNCYAGNQGVGPDLEGLVDALGVPLDLACEDHPVHPEGACQEAAYALESLVGVPSSCVDHQDHEGREGREDHGARGDLVGDDQSLE